MIILQITLEELAATVEQAVSKALKSKGSPKREAQSDILNIEQAAAFLNLSKHTLYGLTSRSAIPHSKRGKRLYFRKDELLKWIEEGRRKTQAEIAEEAANYVSPPNRAA